MAKILKDIKLGLDRELSDELAERLQWLTPNAAEYRILRQSVDARNRHNPHFVMTVEVAENGEKLSLPEFEIEKVSLPKDFQKPVIIGSGPAGLFAALRLVERGIPCHLFERGSESGERIKGINRFWRYGELDRRNNVCYGEGGAGLYSDGKLITRIKSPYIPYVLDRLVQFGAPAEIRYLSNPHVGSDRIRRVIPKLREFLKAQGCSFHFDTQITEILFDDKAVCGVKTEYDQEFSSDQVILATGHSAEDMLEHLIQKDVFVEGKSFAMGLRIEHPQKLINQIQFREAAEHPKLGSANYKIVDHDEKTGIGVYSFCMCPGGFVLSSGTEADGVVCNGMSNYRRNSPFANAAIVMSISHKEMFGKDLLGGMKLRRELETRSYQAVRQEGGSKELPAQKLKDFFAGRSGPVSRGSSPSGEKAVRLDQILPLQMTQRFRKSLENFNLQMKGFISDDAQLYGVESRTSCPVRVTRDEVTLESISHRGLYPCGEGAGYAGGITSAACDGIKIAEKIADTLKNHS
jgi:uncharacterized protein